jgi:hypothetical protein
MRSADSKFSCMLPGMVLLLLFQGGLFETAFAKRVDRPRLKLSNLPDSAVVLINNIRANPDSIGRLEVSPGLTTVQIESRGAVRYAATFLLKKGEEQTIGLRCLDSCASLDIVTEPFGASVDVNGTHEGMTPYVNGFMNPGAYSLTITCVGYEPVRENIFITPEKPALLTFTMQPSAAYQASMQAMKNERKKTRQFAQKVLFGSIAALLGGGAVYCDFHARQKLSLANENAARYDQARANFDSYRGDYYVNRESARKSLGARDMLYFAAGASIFGFTFSFLF